MDMRPPTLNDVIQDGGEQRSVKPMADENNGDKILTYTTLTSPGPGCSKVTTSLVNVSLKFQTLISEIC